MSPTRVDGPVGLASLDGPRSRLPGELNREPARVFGLAAALASPAADDHRLSFHFGVHAVDLSEMSGLVGTWHAPDLFELPGEVLQDQQDHGRKS